MNVLHLSIYFQLAIQTSNCPSHLVKCICFLPTGIGWRLGLYLCSSWRRRCRLTTMTTTKVKLRWSLKGVLGAEEWHLGDHSRSSKDPDEMPSGNSKNLYAHAHGGKRERDKLALIQQSFALTDLKGPVTFIWSYLISRYIDFKKMFGDQRSHSLQWGFWYVRFYCIQKSSN